MTSSPFVIQNQVLKAYTGSDAHVTIPDKVTNISICNLDGLEKPVLGKGEVSSRQVQIKMCHCLKNVVACSMKIRPAAAPLEIMILITYLDLRMICNTRKYGGK